MWGRPSRLQAPSLPEDSAMHAPLISIAVPIYNTARYLPAALDSLLAQDYPHWEGLLWDDGSSDGSGQIAAAYAARDARFRVLGEGCNRGNPAALAAALAQARGGFLGVLDSDNILEPIALSSMHAFLRAHPQLGMAYSQYVEINENGALLGPGTRCNTPYSARQLLVHFMTYQFRLIRRDAYLAVGGFNPMAAYAEDYDLCLRLSETCSIGHLPQPLYRYRIRHGSISQSSRLRQVQASYAAAQRALQRRGLDRSHVLSLGLRVRHQFRPKPATAAPETASVFGAGDPETEQCLRQSPPFDAATASPTRNWAEQVEERYRAFVADAHHRGLDARYDCALEIDSWHVLQSNRPFGGIRGLP